MNDRQERKQPECKCRDVYEQTFQLRGSKDCLDSFPQYNNGLRPIQSHTVVNGRLGLCGDGPGEDGVADHDCWREDVDWSDPRRCLYHCLQIYMQYMEKNTLYELINNLIARNNEEREYDREDTTCNDLQKIKQE